MNAAATLAPPLAAGYVEATTATAVLGWAWTPGRAEPVTVELRLGDAVLAQTTADELRDDLARSGIGDGRHAFTLPVPETARARLAELRVFARAPGADPVPLGSPPPEDGMAERLAQLQRGMEMLVGSQRVLHRNLQAALLARAETAPETPTRPLDADLAALELFVTRLERSLAAVPAPAIPPQRTWPLAATAATAALALATATWALLRALPG